MRAVLTLLIAAAACGDDGVHHLGDAPPCTPSPSTVTVDGLPSYACHDHYKAKVSITNNSCALMLVQSVKISAGMVTTGICGPSGAGTYPAGATGGGQAMLAVGETAVVLNLTGNAFCCTAPGPCPTPLQCDESNTFDVVTNAGTFTSAASSAHLSLDGCTEVCP